MPRICNYPGADEIPKKSILQVWEDGEFKSGCDENSWSCEKFPATTFKVDHGFLHLNATRISDGFWLSGNKDGVVVYLAQDTSKNIAHKCFDRFVVFPLHLDIHLWFPTDNPPDIYLCFAPADERIKIFEYAKKPYE